MAPRFSCLFSAMLALAMLFSPVTTTPVHAEPKSNLTAEEHRELLRLTDLSGGTIQVRFDEKLGTPSFIAGSLSRPLRGEPEQMALTFLNSVRHLYHFSKPKHSFRLLRIDSDELGMKHVRLAHIANNIPVWGDEVIVHIDKTRVVRSVNGHFTPDVEKNIANLGEPKITSEQAIQKAVDAVQATQLYSKPIARLYYYPHTEPSQILLTYVVFVRQLKPTTEWHVFVDASTGHVVNKEPAWSRNHS